ncbi:unnamed protein product [Alopecurus aequalis]
MGAAASSPPEAAAAADPPAKGDVQPVAASPRLEAADPPAKEDIQHATAADAPPEAAAPADSPAKEEIQSAAAADAPAGGDAEVAEDTVVLDAGAESGEQEEEGECGFCLFMKGGGCKDEFVEWEKCIKVAEAVEGGDIVEHCAKATAALRSCMDKYADYYEPILSVERRMSEDLEAEAKASLASPPTAAEGEQGDNKKQAEEVVVVVVEEKEDPAL